MSKIDWKIFVIGAVIGEIIAASVLAWVRFVA